MGTTVLQPGTTQTQTSPCPIARLAGLLHEEPRLEAVAFNPATRRLSIATLGRDQDGRLSERVTDALREKFPPATCVPWAAKSSPGTHAFSFRKNSARP